MTQREKRLAAICGAVTIGFLGIVSVSESLLKPLERLKTETRGILVQVGELESLENQARVAANQLVKLSGQTYGDSPGTVAALAGDRLAALLEQAGLDDRQFQRLATGERRMRGAIEVGWSLQGTGPMKNVVDFLHLLEVDPHLHRVENLVLTPRAGGKVVVSFRYLTLALTGVRPPEYLGLDAPADDEAEPRELFAGIVERDVFRPYIKRPPPPPKPKPKPPKPPTPVPSGPGPEVFKVVSLSEWAGKSEILVMNLNEQTMKKYHVGDELAGGKILKVDYRVLPRHSKPQLNADSRVILQTDSDYWAVDHGDTLAQKYLLQPSQLPPELAADVEQGK